MATKKRKAVKRKPRTWRMWAVIAPWGIRAVSSGKVEAESYKFNDEDKVRRIRITEVVK